MVTAISSKHDPDWFSNDDNFHQLYPPSIQLLSTRHWTPFHITRRIAQYLAPKNSVKVLDIGSGVGKFCLTAAYYMPSAIFFGVEQRKDLVAHAEAARETLGLQNAHFIHRNFTQVDFKQYDHFYFYNSFHENLIATDKIDDNIEYSTELYNYYNRRLHKKLDEMPAGTRLVTFHSLGEEMPTGYHLVEMQVEGLLKFWIRE